jgi:Relaxase/Mobilisation nuclease domain
LGLSEQARAVVFHTKEGRLHCHAVWSRIDLERLKAVQLSNDRQKLRSVVQEFARDHGLELPDGLKQDRGKDALVKG